MHVFAQSLRCVQLFATPGTVACQASLSRLFSKPRILEWVAISPSRDLPGPGIEYTFYLINSSIYCVVKLLFFKFIYFLIEG